ncbi:MauE/DoxX family redox-associated membrane protein [Nocardioides sp.]|uniref:MauE/DoxX family redox-associated membrane protein n=1 Tax=Nocardioides sp. TaxID=35761 RepID=UPI0039E2243D
MKEWLALVARLVTGGVWIWAGAAKITDPDGAVMAVRAYQLLPGQVAETVGYALPTLEVVIGAALILGLLTRGAAVVSALLFLAFIIGIASAWARGLEIDCGCFGGGGYDPDAASKYPWEIARDTGLLLLSGFIVWVGNSRLGLDRLLFRRTPTEAGA